MLALRLHDERHARAGREKAAAAHNATAPSAPSAPTPGPCKGRCTKARLGTSGMAAVAPCVAHLASPLLPPPSSPTRAGRITLRTERRTGPGIQRVCGNGEEEEEIIHFYVPEDHSVPLCQLSSLGLLVGPAASSCPETRDGGYRRRETFSPAMSTNFPEPHGVCHNMLRSI